VDADEIVVRRVLAGDKPAFGALIERHRGAALRLARRLVSASHEAEDVVQEALLQAFLSLDRLRAPERFCGWLLGIVVNLARSRRRRPVAYSLDDLAGGRPINDPALLDPMPSPLVVQESLEMHRLVDEAVAALPAEQRAAVQLHYVEGLKLWEIASLLGAPLGTIKARLHRARAQLRQSLLDTMTTAAPQPPVVMEGRLMVEVTLEDVVVRAPKHEEPRWFVEAKDYNMGLVRVLLLRERAGDRILPIWVGPVDGDLIAMRLVDLTSVRPMPTDLLARLLEVGSMQLEKVVVHTLRDSLFIASLWIHAGGASREIDARPSDAIGLALEVGAPIFVAEEVFGSTEAFVLHAGEEMAGLEARHARAMREGKTEPEPVEREWRSVRSLPRHEHRHIRPRVR
jgi:RNA polymerase sigma factor (sigma-70 family)